MIVNCSGRRSVASYTTSFPMFVLMTPHNLGKEKSPQNLLRAVSEFFQGILGDAGKVLQGAVLGIS